ncbi:hypothetical protein PO610_18615, partial [Escherichia coli]
DRNRSHWSTSKTPSYTKSVSWQHHPRRKAEKNAAERGVWDCLHISYRMRRKRFTRPGRT